MKVKQVKKEDMNVKKLFDTASLPFEEMEKWGIGREAFLEMPEEVQAGMLTGRRSPLLLLKAADGEGNEVSFPAKILFFRNREGEVKLGISRVEKEVRNEHGITEAEMERLKRGETVLAVSRKDGGRHFMQLDRETNTIVSAREADIEIPAAVKDIQLGMEQRKAIREGRPVELQVGDTTVTAGIDLNSFTGFRMVKGDMEDWKRRKEIEWDRVNPGVIGYWKTEENAWEYRKFMEDDRGQVREEKEERTVSRGRRM